MGFSFRSLVRERTIWLPNWKGWGLIIGITLLAAYASIKFAYPLLAPTQRVTANILIVEGWLPEYALEAAIDEFKQHPYELLLTSGGPLWEGHHASGFHSYAELAAQVLRSLDFKTNQLHVAPGPKVWKHRTFQSALATSQYLAASKIEVTGINVMTLGPHGRRTKIIYDRVFESQCPVGIIAHPSSEYDKDRWGRTSEGTKHILTETMAATYEWIFRSGR